MSSLDVSIPAVGECLHLVEQHARIDHHAVADHGGAARGEDPRREQVQGVLLAVHHDRVAGVVAALVADHVVDGLTELVGRLAFAFVAPLGTDDHDCGHVRTLSRLRGAGPSRT